LFSFTRIGDVGAFELCPERGGESDSQRENDSCSEHRPWWSADVCEVACARCFLIDARVLLVDLIQLTYGCCIALLRGVPLRQKLSRIDSDYRFHDRGRRRANQRQFPSHFSAFGIGDSLDLTADGGGSRCQRQIKRIDPAHGAKRVPLALDVC